MSVDRREQRASRGTRRAGEAVMRRRQPAESAAEPGGNRRGTARVSPEPVSSVCLGREPRSHAGRVRAPRNAAATEGRVIPREKIYQRVRVYAMIRRDRSVDGCVQASPQARACLTGLSFTSTRTSASAARSLPSRWTRRLLVTVMRRRSPRSSRGSAPAHLPLPASARDPPAWAPLVRPPRRAQRRASRTGRDRRRRSGPRRLAA